MKVIQTWTFALHSSYGSRIEENWVDYKSIWEMEILRFHKGGDVQTKM